MVLVSEDQTGIWSDFLEQVPEAEFIVLKNQPDQKLDSCFHLCVESEPELESSFLEFKKKECHRTIS
jgi:hypothetical protein